MKWNLAHGPHVMCHLSLFSLRNQQWRIWSFSLDFLSFFTSKASDGHICLLVCLFGAFQVLEACMNNCGKRFHSEAAKFRFLNELIKILTPKVLLHTDVSARCISVPLLLFYSLTKCTLQQNQSVQLKRLFWTTYMVQRLELKCINSVQV